MKRIAALCLLLLLTAVFPGRLCATRIRSATAITRGIYSGVFMEQLVADVSRESFETELTSDRALLEIGYGGEQWDIFGLVGGVDVDGELGDGWRPGAGGGARLELADFGGLNWGAGFSGLYWHSEPSNYSRITFQEYSFFTGVEYEAASGVYPYGGLAFFQQRGISKGNTVFRQDDVSGVFGGVNIFVPIDNGSSYRDGFYTLNLEARYIGDIRFDFGVGINFGYDPVTMEDYRPDRKPDTYPLIDLPSDSLLKAAEDVRVGLLQWQMEPDLEFSSEELAAELEKLGMKNIAVYEKRDSFERAVLQNRVSQQQMQQILKQLDRQLLVCGFLSYDGLHYQVSTVIHDRRGRELIRATGRTKEATISVLARKIVESIGLGASAPYIDHPPLRF
ncbi:MAG: hypothetical protein ACLFN5_00215 [bacterium]